MKKIRDCLLYCVLFGMLVLLLGILYFVKDSAITQPILFVAFGWVCYLFGYWCNEAKNIVYYNRAMDAWANFREEELKKVKDESSRGFEVLDSGNEEQENKE